MDNLKFLRKYLRVRTEKLHRIKVKKKVIKIWKVFFGGKTQFFRAKNLSVNNEGRDQTSVLLSVMFSHHKT